MLVYKVKLEVTVIFCMDRYIWIFFFLNIILNFCSMDAFKITTRCCQHRFLQIAEIKIFVVSCSIFQCFSEYENAS